MKSFNPANRSFQFAIVMIGTAAVVPAFTHAATPGQALVSSPYYLIDEHTDLSTNVTAGGAWDVEWETDSAIYSSGNAIAYFGPNTGVTRPTAAGWSFTGAGSGQKIYFSSASKLQRTPYLGLGAEATAFGTVQEHLNSDPRLGFEAAFIYVGVVGVYGDSSALPDTQRAAAPGSYSSFTGISTGNRTLPVTTPAPGADSQWVTNAIGNSVDAGDFAVTYEGGHDHYYQAFTNPGFYELDVQARTVLTGGAPSVSDVKTFYYYVNDKPAALREKGYLQDRGTATLGETLPLANVDMGRVDFDNTDAAPLKVLLSVISTTPSDLSTLRTYLTANGQTIDDTLLPGDGSFDIALRFDTTAGLSSFEWDFYGGAYQFEGTTRNWKLDAIQIAAVPEPTLLGLAAIAGVGLLRRTLRA